MTSQPKTTQTTIITALIIAIIFVVASLGFASAGADNTGFITGTSWFDSNGNGMRELNEVAAPNTVITLRVVGENVTVAGDLVVFSAADGTFNFGTVGYGDYVVQAENGGTVEVSVSEANSAVSIDIPVDSADNAPNLQGAPAYQIFLPLVSN